MAFVHASKTAPRSGAILAGSGAAGGIFGCKEGIKMGNIG